MTSTETAERDKKYLLYVEMFESIQHTLTEEWKRKKTKIH